MATDFANAANRMAPGAPGSSPAKIAFSNGANAASQLRSIASNFAGGGGVYISVKTTSGVCLAFGDANVAAPTTNDPRFDASDGWQDMIILQSWTHVRCFGDGAAGTLYVWFSGI